MNKEKLKELCLPMVFYVAARSIDSVVTAYSANKNGTTVEGNPITKYFMDFFGINEGVTLNSATELSIMLPISYKRQRIFDISSNNMLYILGIFHLIAAATHIPYILNDYMK